MPKVDCLLCKSPVLLVQGDLQPLLSHLQAKHRVHHHSSLIASLHFLTGEEHGHITGAAEPRIVNMKETNPLYVKDELDSIAVMSEVKVPDSEDIIQIKMPKSRVEREYHGMTLAEMALLEKAIESGHDHFGKELTEKEMEQKIARLTYLKDFTGSFAGPYDRPMHVPVRLGKSSLPFDDYTNYRHEPKEKHYKYDVDHTLWEQTRSTEAVKTLLPIEETDENDFIAGPCQTMKVTEAGFNKILYTGEDGKCLIPCLCSMCNSSEDTSCPEHVEVNSTSSGFDPETDMITVRCADTYPLIKSKVELDSYDSNKYCLDAECKYGVRYDKGEHKGEPMLASDRMDGWELSKDTVKKCRNAKTGQSCNCPNCPYCKTVQVIKFTGIPTDCDECTEDLYDHEANHLIVHDKCKFCDYIVIEANDFENKDEFSFWKENAMIRNQNDKTCHICHTEFKWTRSMKEHLNNIHHTMEQKEYVCDQCGKRSLYKRNMNYHMKTAHATEESKFNCKICNFSTLFKANLQQHVERLHEEKTCDQCDFVTENHMEFKEHVKSAHSKKPKLQCEQCDYETDERKRLTQHVKIAHKEKMCDQCDFVTQNHTEFKEHVKSAHSKLQCEQCDYETEEKRRMTQHVKRKH